MMAIVKRVVACVLVGLFVLLTLNLALKFTILNSLNFASSDSEHAIMQRWNSFYLRTIIVVIVSFIPLHAIYAALCWAVDKSINRTLNLVLLIPSLFILCIWLNAFGIKVLLFG